VLLLVASQHTVRAIATDVVAWSVCQCVHVVVTTASRANTDELIEMQPGDRLACSRNLVLHGDPNSPKVRGALSCVYNRLYNGLHRVSTILEGHVCDTSRTRNSAIAEGPRDASCQLKS